MDKGTLNKWIMYYQIKSMERDGHSVTSISNELVMDWRTVKKYLSMSEVEYEQFLLGQETRNKKLAIYENFVRTQLVEHPETRAAQMHDWLKEHHPDLPQVPAKTVYNFIQYIRQKYNIPYQKALRDFMIVPECEYGKQAQVDFGEYNMRTEKESRKKVWFFSMVLSRSRMKFVCFNDKPFTTHTAVIAHEKAFEYFKGVPTEVVYDQDKLFLVSENVGKLLLTEEFKSYVRMRNFALHFCRKSDPQSKGKIENVIKYVKQNFLYNRLYLDIDTLNQQSQAWLARTANAVVHARTKKVPENEWMIERSYLSPFVPIPLTPSAKMYYVKKDNTVNYHSNFYSLPLGTYQGPNTQASIKEIDGHIEITNASNHILCKHLIPDGKGNIIRNTDHGRDKTEKINTMITQTASLFADKEAAIIFLEKIRTDKPRYIRDQILMIRKTIEKYPQETISQTLVWCITNSVFDAVDFTSVSASLSSHFNQTKQTIPSIKLIEPASIEKANIYPQISCIDDYENLFLSPLKQQLP